MAPVISITAKETRNMYPKYRPYTNGVSKEA